MIAAHPASTTPPGRWRTNTTILCDDRHPMHWTSRPPGRGPPNAGSTCRPLVPAGHCGPDLSPLVRTGSGTTWKREVATAISAAPAAMAAYLGAGDEFDTSITDFAQRYADQNEIDYQGFVDAVRTGRIPAVEG